MTSGPSVDLSSWEETVKKEGRFCEYEVTCDGNDPDHRYSMCRKHPGHESFIPFNQLSKEMLPDGHRTEELVCLIRSLSTLTTRISVNKVSSDRPQRWPSCNAPYPCQGAMDLTSYNRMGTGFIESAHKMFAPVQGKCPCPECILSGNRSNDWWEIRISTATHLVFDGTEAASTVVDWFYDSDDTSTFYRFYGVRVCEIPNRIENDRCVLVCVTHNVDFGSLVQQVISNAQRIQAEWSRRTESFFQYHTLIVSHPHGISTKAISMGKTHFVTVPIGPKYPVLKNLPFPPGMSYRLPASSSLSTSTEDEINTEHPQRYKNRRTLMSIANTQSANIPPHTQELSLPNNMAFVLPPDAPFARRLSLGKSHSFVFPPGTRYFLEDGHEFTLPLETEFIGWPLDDILVSISYNAETCCGSSGANVFTLEPRRLQHPPSRCRSLATFIHCYSSASEENSSGYNLFVTQHPTDLITDVHLRAKA